MGKLIKSHKVPLEWNETTAKIIEDMFVELFNNVQSKYVNEVSAKPKDTEGFNGEIRSDATNGKIYIKQNGAWKEATLS